MARFISNPQGTSAAIVDDAASLFETNSDGSKGAEWPTVTESEYEVIVAAADNLEETYFETTVDQEAAVAAYLGLREAAVQRALADQTLSTSDTLMLSNPGLVLAAILDDNQGGGGSGGSGSDDDD